MRHTTAAVLIVCLAALVGVWMLVDVIHEAIHTPRRIEVQPHWPTKARPHRDPDPNCPR